MEYNRNIKLAVIGGGESSREETTHLKELAQDLGALSDYDFALEDDYVHTREGPYAFTRDTLDRIKLQAVREFCFSKKRLGLFFDRMPGFYEQRDIDASIFANIISAQVNEEDTIGSGYAKQLHRHFLVAKRFSAKSSRGWAPTSATEQSRSYPQITNSPVSISRIEYPCS